MAAQMHGDTLTPLEHDRTMRADIAAGWRRAQINGLTPSMDVQAHYVDSIDRSGRLMIAAAPVLSRMVDDLADTPFAILLADHDATIIDRRGNSPMRALDDVKAVPGARYCEQVSGVNALASAHELRRPIAVNAGEHFLESLRAFCCFGAPIIHPLTRRLEGVLDVSGPASAFTPLLRPFVLRSAAEIRQRLVEGARGADRELLSAFQAATSRRRGAVLALGAEVTLTSPAAADLLRSEDHATLRALTTELVGADASIRHTFYAASGTVLDIEATGVPGGAGVIICAARSGLPASSTPPSRLGDDSATVRSKVTLITGEPGSGRTYAAHKTAGTDAEVFDASEHGGLGWLSAARVALGHSRTVVVDNLDRLTARVAAELRQQIRQSHAPVILTSPPLEQLAGEHAALAAMALSRPKLTPVRDYGVRFAELAYALLRQYHPSTNVRFTAPALDILAAQPWPGNIPELAEVIAECVGRRTSGDITERDLPPSHASRPPGRLTKLERVERDTILAVLQSVDGNKVAAAAELGIGRTTLYKRLRRYRIPA